MPADATLNGDGFRFYRWLPADGGEPTDVLSVTSIRRLCGESFNLVNWQIANVIDVVLGTQKRTKVGPRGGVSETRQVWEYPSEFVRRYAECANDDPDSDVLASQPKIDDLRKWLRDTADAPRNIAAVRGTLVHEAIEKGVAWDRIERAYVENAVLGLTTRDRKRMKDVADEDVDFIRNGVRQYWDFRRKVPMRILAQEVQVWNLTHGYAGTVDALVWLLGRFDEHGEFIPLQPENIERAKALKSEAVLATDIAEIGGTIALLDWKTSSGVYTDQVVQAHAYMSAEFVGAGGVVDKRLTTILEAAFLGGLVHIRPNGWGLHLFPYSEDVVRAFLGSVAFARMLARYPEPTEIFTVNIKGQSEEVDDAVGG